MLPRRKTQRRVHSKHERVENALARNQSHRGSDTPTASALRDRVNPGKIWREKPNLEGARELSIFSSSGKLPSAERPTIRSSSRLCSTHRPRGGSRSPTPRADLTRPAACQPTPMVISGRTTTSSQAPSPYASTPPARRPPDRLLYSGTGITNPSSNGAPLSPPTGCLGGGTLGAA